MPPRGGFPDLDSLTDPYNNFRECLKGCYFPCWRCFKDLSKPVGTSKKFDSDRYHKTEKIILREWN